MKHYKVSKLVNDLRDTAIKYKNCQSLREALSNTLSNYIDINEDNDLTMKMEWYLDDVSILLQAIMDIKDNIDNKEIALRYIDNTFKILNIKNEE